MDNLLKIYQQILQEDINAEKKSEADKVNIDNFCEINETDIGEDGEAEDNDGWDESVQNVLNDVLTQTDSLQYEVKNCVKGSYTQCKTNEELASYLRNLSEQFNLAADEISNL